MNSAASFERFDYSLRANKHIERRLVFDLLMRADARVGLQGHQYLGFGSMWFGDFRPAHRLLRLSRMLSMERDEHAERASFNRPYDCITVVPGDSGQTLEGFDNETWSRPFLAWFDYDGRLCEPVVRDIQRFVQRCAPDSVLLVTVNANRGAYRARNADPKMREHTSVGAIEHFLGIGMVSPQFEPTINAVGAYQDLDEERVPECLADSILTFLSHAVVAAGRTSGETPVHFERLISISHKDGADMVTVGGAITSPGNLQHWRSASGFAAEGHQTLNFVPFTLKEKLALDSCLPHMGDGFPARAHAAGIRLSDDQIEKYRKYYAHFPVFVESFL